MTSPTPNQGLILPQAGSLNNVPGDFAAYNARVENRLVQRYSSSIDREVRNPTPEKGEVSYLEDTDRHERFDGTGWKNIRGGLDHSYLPGEVGQTLISFTSSNDHVRTVFFATPFTTPPVVFTNINTSAGAASGFLSRSFNVSETSFSLYVAQVIGLATTWSNIPVDWVAIGRS